MGVKLASKNGRQIGQQNWSQEFLSFSTFWKKKRVKQQFFKVFLKIFVKNFLWNIFLKNWGIKWPTKMAFKNGQQNGLQKWESNWPPKMGVKLASKFGSQEFLSFSAFWKKKRETIFLKKSLLKISCEIFFLKNEGQKMGQQKWIPRISLFFKNFSKFS